MSPSFKLCEQVFLFSGIMGIPRVFTGWLWVDPPRQRCFFFLSPSYCASGYLDWKWQGERGDEQTIKTTSKHHKSLLFMDLCNLIVKKHCYSFSVYCKGWIKWNISWRKNCFIRLTTRQWKFEIISLSSRTSMAPATWLHGSSKKLCRTKSL